MIVWVVSDLTEHGGPTVHASLEGACQRGQELVDDYAGEEYREMDDVVRCKSQLEAWETGVLEQLRTLAVPPAPNSVRPFRSDEFLNTEYCDFVIELHEVLP
jgi:hypothetical protein